MTINVPVSHHNQGLQPTLALRKVNTACLYILSYLATIQDGHHILQSLTLIPSFISTLLCASSPTQISTWSKGILIQRQTNSLPWKFSHLSALNETWFSPADTTSTASPSNEGYSLIRSHISKDTEVGLGFSYYLVTTSKLPLSSYHPSSLHCSCLTTYCLSVSHSLVMLPLDSQTNWP